MARALVAVGSNLSPRENILKGFELLTMNLKMEGVSTFYKTAPLLDRDQPDYLNGMFLAETDLTSEELEQLLTITENMCGRLRDPRDRYASRTLDLDLLIFNNHILDSGDLLERHFNLTAAAELLPDFFLPEKGQNLQQIFQKKTLGQGILAPDKTLTQELKQFLDSHSNDPISEEKQ